jgi:hypothetical protein
VKAGTVRHADRAPRPLKNRKGWGTREGKGEKKSKFERAGETPALRKQIAQVRSGDYLGYGFDVSG